MIKPNNLKFISVMSVLTLSVFSTVACTPPNKDSGAPASGPTTEWKEGYGGDSMAIEVVRHIETICFRTRTMRKALLSSTLETEKDVAAEICGLLDPKAVSVVPVDQPMVNGAPKDAANYPQARPRRLEVKRSYWSSTAAAPEKREALLLHELLPLIGLEDADYVRSSRILLALEAKEGRVSKVSCDEKRVEALFAAGDAEFLKFFSRDYGGRQCGQIGNVLLKHITGNSFEASLKLDLQHFYLWGLFTELVRANRVQEMDKLVEQIRTVMSSLPDAFADWSTETCQMIAHFDGDRPRRCGGFLNVIAGSSPRLEYMTASIGSRSFDDEFTRATLQVLGIFQLHDTWDSSKNPMIVNNQISSSIVQSAIEGQNWMTLYFLGRLQHRLNPELRPSAALLKDINFRVVQNNAPTAAIADGLYDSHVIPLKQCMPDEIRIHAESILDSKDLRGLVCGSHGST